MNSIINQTAKNLKSELEGLTAQGANAMTNWFKQC